MMVKRYFNHTSLLNKVTSFVIALIIILTVLLYMFKTSNAVKRTGVIKSLLVKKAYRTRNTFSIVLTSADSIVFYFEEITPFFDVQKSLGLRPGNQIAYTVSPKNEVLGIKNIAKQQGISPAFFIINKVMSNIFVYLALMVLTLVQLSYIFYNYSFARKAKSNDTGKVSVLVDQINELFKKYIILIPLFFFLFFYLLYKFSQHFNALVEPTSGFEAQKYILNFIVFWFLAMLLLINKAIERKINKFNE